MILITRDERRILPIRFGLPESPQATDIITGIDVEEAIAGNINIREYKLNSIIGIEGSYAFPIIDINQFKKIK